MLFLCVCVCVLGSVASGSSGMANDKIADTSIHPVERPRRNHSICSWVWKVENSAVARYNNKNAENAEMVCFLRIVVPSVSLALAHFG